MTELTRSEFAPAPRVSTVPPPRYETPLVPRNSISGRALVAVVAIMTFLASLTTGGVILVSQAASAWQADVSREVTVQLIPADGRDLDAEVAKAASVVKNFPGIADVRPYSKEESEKLLEPWLGTGLTLSELPVPRLIVVKIARGAAPDLPQLAGMLKEQVPGALLDDHRQRTHGAFVRLRRARRREALLVDSFGRDAEAHKRAPRTTQHRLGTADEEVRAR